MSNFNERIIRAAKLDVSLYEEVEADTTALGQAMGVVILSSIAAGLGTITIGGPRVIIVVVFSTILALIGWYIWASITYFIGTKILPEAQTRADHGQLLRTIGFSSSPGVIRVLGLIPGLTGLVFLVSSIWMFIAMIIAVRQALDFDSTWRASGVVLIGAIVQGLILALLFSILGTPATV